MCDVEFLTVLSKIAHNLKQVRRLDNKFGATLLFPVFYGEQNIGVDDLTYGFQINLLQLLDFVQGDTAR